VLQIVPDAEVTLFGSRAKGISTSESDWDILIITHSPISRSLKNKVHEVLFPISVDISSFINFILVNKNDWINNSAYYSLRTNLLHEK
jgi:predicted nucleotidyltransferase